MNLNQIQTMEIQLPIIAPNKEFKNIPNPQFTNYSEYLDLINIKYKPYEYYWQVGETDKIQGWILHLSIIISQLPELFWNVIPFLVSEQVAFKIIKDRYTAQCLLDGNLGNKSVGKALSIYPNSDSQAILLIQKLMEKTKTFKGPAIPTDILLNGIIYTRYGSFNPIIKIINGEEVKHIYNCEGELIPDPYSIPFSLPQGINWPFSRFATPIVAKPSKLLNHSYYAISVLKNDVKGKVIKALYFKKLWQIKTCVLKQGCKNAFSDDWGRDVQARLKWQEILHHKLTGIIPIPKIIDCFTENENAYLVMEFVNGKSLINFVSEIYQNQTWLDLTVRDRLQLLDLLYKIVRIVNNLHKNGFIHRDITAENFLIDRHSNVFLIDLELCWPIQSVHQYPPFQLGTPGYMSPQQIAMEPPSIKDDIYALGALMIVIFTNLIPTKLPILVPNGAIQFIIFLTGSEELARLISACTHPNPEERPDLEFIQDFLCQYQSKSKLDGTTSNYQPSSHNSETLKNTIQAAIQGLACSDTLSPKHRWHSLVHEKDNELGNVQLEMTVYKGWHTGVAGPLWLLSRAVKAGFDTSACQIAINNSWDFLRKSYFTTPENSSVGLFNGAAGIALALTEALSSGQLAADQTSDTLLTTCFQQTSNLLTLSEGVAGQGIALLRASELLKRIDTEQLLESYIQQILITQQTDGSYIFIDNGRLKTKVALGLSYGISGIIWFLLAYLGQKPRNIQVKESVIKALNWLIKKAEIKSSNKLHINKSKYSLTLLFIKAFESIKNSQYNDIAIANLKAFPSHTVNSDFGLYSGQAALGELYLEAFKVLGADVWRERAEWIAQFFIHCFHAKNQKKGYWVFSRPDLVTADLFNGNAGIIHFLVRNYNAEILSHPLWPNTQNIH